MSGFLLLSLLGVSLACAFAGTRLITWTVALCATFLLFGFNAPIPLFVLILVGLVLAVVLIPLHTVEIRRQFLSAPFLAKYRSMLPTLSDTETAAPCACARRASSGMG